MRKAIFFLGFLLSVGCLAQTEVSSFTPGVSSEGITYFLPKTVLEVEVEITKVKYTPGEFCKYAERYLRLTGISDTPDEYWEIRGIRVNPIGLPDPQNAYSVKLKDKTSAPLVELTEDGILKSINVESSAKKKTQATPLIPAKKRLNARDFMTEEILMASSSAKMAELVAKEIYNIRESKNAIVRGQADNMPKDGESLKLMLANLEEQEQAMLDMFTGITERENTTYTVRLTPNQNLTKEILFRFSKHLGVLGVNDLAGTPVYVTLTDLSTLPAATEEKAKKRKLGGIIYNVPGKARIVIFDNQKTFCEGDVPVTQFGSTEVLSDNLFNKKMNTKVTFNPITGGLIKIEKEE